MPQVILGSVTVKSSTTHLLNNHITVAQVRLHEEDLTKGALTQLPFLCQVICLHLTQKYIA